MTEPYIESQNFKKYSSLGKDSDFNNAMNKLNEDGYCIIDLDIDDLIDNANNDIEKAIKKNHLKLILQHIIITIVQELLKLGNSANQLKKLLH